MTTYRIDYTAESKRWTIEGWIAIEAASQQEAREKFMELTLTQVLGDIEAYDNIEVAEVAAAAAT